jgi:hypothetical protein
MPWSKVLTFDDPLHYRRRSVLGTGASIPRRKDNSAPN